MKPTGDWRALLDQARKALADAKEIRVSPACIRPMRGQPRVYFNADSLARLGDSMCSIGQLYPGIVRRVEDEGTVQYELLDGERRWRAAKLKGLTEYRALLVSVEDAAAAFLIASVANFNRDAHTPTEISDSIDAMMRLKMPLKEIAEVLGLSEVWAAQLHGLQKLIPAVRAMLDPTLEREHRISLMAAVQISKADASLQHDLARDVRDKRVSYTQLRGEIIRRSRASEAPLRLREAKKVDRWKSLKSKASLVRRLATELENMLNETSDIFEGRPPSAVEFVANELRTAADRAALVAGKIESANRWGVK